MCQFFKGSKIDASKKADGSKSVRSESESQGSKPSADSKTSSVKTKPEFVGPEFHPAVIKSKLTAQSAISKIGGAPSRTAKSEDDRKTSSGYTSNKATLFNRSKTTKSRSRSPIPKKKLKRAPSRSPSPEIRKKPNSKASKSNR